MLPLLRRWTFYTVLAAAVLFLLLQIAEFLEHDPPPPPSRKRGDALKKMRVHQLQHPGFFGRKFKWRDLPQHYPVTNMTKLPAGPAVDVPKIQFDFAPETDKQSIQRQTRLAAVKEAFLHSWDGYKSNAWLQDEVAPVSGGPNNPFGGWGATLVDSLDTLWIMGLEEEFKLAVSELRKIDFTQTESDELNVFETTIRYMGGFLSAYDLSGQRYRVLLDKAVELGEMLYHAVDTPNRMPRTRWKWMDSMLGEPLEAARFSILAEVGSLTLEFTRMSQLTGDPKWYDAIVRIMGVFEGQQNHTKVPGLFGLQVDTLNADFTRDTTFSIGGMADSLYEYFPKQHLMIGGKSDSYRNMYTTSLEAIKKHILFRPLNPENRSILMPGTLKRQSSINIHLTPEMQHLTCYAGGMVALAARAFSQPDEIETARQLTEGCIWAYENSPTGIMPEIFHAAPCAEDLDSECKWSEQKYYNAVAAPNAPKREPSREEKRMIIDNAQTIIKDHRLSPGFTKVVDSRYQLRPEAIESLFVLYRITGDTYYQDKAWTMFQSISAMTITKIAYAGIKDVREVGSELIDSMESFWTAETLKYFYLIFSEPDVVNLDEYVLNTEAHPLLRPRS